MTVLAACDALECARGSCRNCFCVHIHMRLNDRPRCRRSGRKPFGAGCHPRAPFRRGHQRVLHTPVGHQPGRNGCGRCRIGNQMPFYSCVSGLVLRHPWVSALRQTEQALQQERARCCNCCDRLMRVAAVRVSCCWSQMSQTARRLGQIVPRSLEEYNAAVGMEYLKVSL